MAFKFVVFLASLAVASAGYLQEAPLSYSTLSHAAPLAYNSYAHAAPLAYNSYAHAAPVTYAAHASYATPAIGATHESTVRSHDATVSHYSKAVDTPYSSVPLSYAHAAPAVATYAHAAPVTVAKQVSYAAPALTTYAHAAPAVATYAHATPAIASHSTVAHVAYDGSHAHYAF
ncbi:hypothetical protein pipiens_016687 [Culex pipiens pipiens]|uniref:Uncharacterized protein n=1 Tax=Culex pipiens pipiens TaxID=38569 RepID=A0ABD1CK76_CULPP